MSGTSALRCHRRSSMPSVQAVTVDLHLTAEADLAVAYCLDGKLDDLRIPFPCSPKRTDELWQHSCFELFVMGDNGPAYREFNLSPSGEWAAYNFADYRQGNGFLGMTDPNIRCVTTPQTLKLEAVLSRTVLPSGTQLQVGVSAVIEDKRGTLSYWALAHTSAKPDFHCAGTFLLNLDRRTREVRT